MQKRGPRDTSGLPLAPHPAMNQKRNQGGTLKPQAQQKHPDEWSPDLSPNHLAGQNIGTGSELDESGMTALQLRKRGARLAPLDDDELRQVPVLSTGTRLQQGATYIDLTDPRLQEFTATGDMSASEGHAFVPKDRVPYQIWNRLTGEAKPGQERKSGDEGQPLSGPER